MANIPYPQYPADGVVAIKGQWAGVHQGVGNYQQGGYNLTARELALSGIELAEFSYRSQSQNFFARAYYPVSTGANSFQATPSAAVTVKWYIAANSVEVANNSNLAAEFTQLYVNGMP